MVGAIDLVLLIEQIRAGDDRALATLYAHSVNRLFSLARRIVRCSETAQEVVCDVFVDVWKNAVNYDVKRGTVLAWLCVATRNRAIDRLRKDLRHRHLLGLSSQDHAWTLAIRPDDALGEFQDGTAVHGALCALSPLRKQLMMMAFFEGLSHEVIARAVGLPLGTVKSHVRRALLIMRGIMLTIEGQGRLPSRLAVSLENTLARLVPIAGCLVHSAIQEGS